MDPAGACLAFTSTFLAQGKCLGPYREIESMPALVPRSVFVDQIPLCKPADDSRKVFAGLAPGGVDQLPSAADWVALDLRQVAHGRGVRREVEHPGGNRADVDHLSDRLSLRCLKNAAEASAMSLSLQCSSSRRSLSRGKSRSRTGRSRSCWQQRSATGQPGDSQVTGDVHYSHVPAGRLGAWVWRKRFRGGPHIVEAVLVLSLLWPQQVLGFRTASSSPKLSVGLTMYRMWSAPSAFKRE